MPQDTTSQWKPVDESAWKPVEEDNKAILAAQAAKYPTSAEQGGKPGSITLPQDEQPMPFKVGPFKGTVNPPLAVRGLLGAASNITNYALPGGDTPRKITAPQLSPEEQFGSDVFNTMAGGKAVGKTLSEAGRLLPNAERAGQKFTNIREAAKDVAPNLEPAYGHLQRMEEISNTGGGSLPDVATKLKTAIQPASVDLGTGRPLLINPAQLKYPQTFDFASNAKRISTNEANSLSPMMRGTLKQFAGALQDANRDAAAKVGMGDMFDQAMREYHRAKGITDAMDIAKKFVARAGAKAALTGAGAGGAYAIYRGLTR